MPGTKMKFGAFIAPFHPLDENPTLAIERDIELVQWMDKLGYDEAWIGEHHSAGYELIASPELFIATLAERTRNIKLGTGVSSLPYHQPLMLADRINQLDHITRGRVMFGVGPGAHGRFIENGRRHVTFTEKMPETWLERVETKGHGVIGGEVLTHDEEADEFLLMGLRLVEGIDLPRYEALSGRALSNSRIAVLQEEGLVEPIGNTRLRATQRGMIVLDAVVADLAA